MTPLENAPSDWLNHGFTAQLRKHLRGQTEVAHQSLLAACRKSNDPEVARRYAEYAQLTAFAGQLGKERDGSPDGDD